MNTVQRRTPSRLFQQSEYRVLHVDPTRHAEEVGKEYCVYFAKRSRNRRQDVTFIRQKSFLLKAAGQAIHLELFHSFKPLNTNRVAELKYKNQRASHNNKDLQTGPNLFDVLPKEIIFQILKSLQPDEIACVAQTSKAMRLIAYDNMLWKYLCFSTWCNSAFMLSAEISDYQHSLRSWYNLHAPSSTTRLSSEQVQELFAANKWRVIYAALVDYEKTPSIIHRYSTRFNQRTAECFPTSRIVKYECSLGEYQLVGIPKASFVEYLVFNFLKSFHRRYFPRCVHYPIYNIRDFGLKTTRSPRGQHNGEFFRRRGYYLKTLENRKVHITYRYFPTIRFRLFRDSQDQRDFLLCQDVFLSSGETVDCYTAYEIVNLRRRVDTDAEGNESENNTEHMEIEEQENGSTSPATNSVSIEDITPIFDDDA